MTILFDADGNEIEVPSEDEIKDLKLKAESAESVNQQVSKIKEVLGAKDEEDLVEAVKLAKEAMNPNWPEARNKINRLTHALKELNPDAEINEDGTVKGKDQAIDMTKISEEATRAARKEILGTEISRQLQKFPEENREAVKRYFEKLTSGEELSLDTINTFMDSASKLVLPEYKTDNRVVGLEPKISVPEGKDFSETPQGQEIAKELYGDQAFSAKKE